MTEDMQPQSGLDADELRHAIQTRLDFIQNLYNKADTSPSTVSKYYDYQNETSHLRYEELENQEKLAHAFDESKLVDKLPIEIWRDTHKLGRRFARTKASMLAWNHITDAQTSILSTRMPNGGHDLFNKSMVVDPENGDCFNNPKLLNNQGKCRNQHLLMKEELLDDYNADDDRGFIFDPVLGRFLHPAFMHVKCLFPPSSAEHTPAIFGAPLNCTSTENGLILEERIKSALEQGAITLVPYVPMAMPQPGKDVVVDTAALRKWQQSEVKQYRLWVLRWDVEEVTSIVDSMEPMDNLVALHGQVLFFQNDSRPATELMWWMHMNAIFRAIHFQESGSVMREIQNSTMCWATGGQYVRPGVLQRVVEAMWRYLDQITAESIMEHERQGNEPTVIDNTMVSVMAFEMTKFAVEVEGL